MIYKPEYIKTILNTNLIGILFNVNFISPYIDKLSHIVECDINTLIKTRNDIYNELIYSEIISPLELNDCISKIGYDLFFKKISAITSIDICDIIFTGPHVVEYMDCVNYFIKLESSIIDEIRTSLALNKKDIYINILVKNDLIHNVSRGYDTLIKVTSEINTLYNKYKLDNVFILDLIANLPDALMKAEKYEVLSISNEIICIRIEHTMIQVALINNSGVNELWMVTMSEYII